MTANIDDLSSDDTVSLKVRLLSNSIVVGDCWEWQGAKNGKGYGSISVGGRLVLVHRLSYRVHRGKIGDRLVCHHCDNPKCINPAHLFLGTARDNALDMRRKGREPENPARKISAADARSMRDKYAAGTHGATKLAKEYGLAREYVHAILRGDYWPNAGGPLFSGR
jgi:hypothetical protein